MAKSTKQVVALIKLQITANKATPAPPVGPALGQAGVNIMEFCKQFNAQTAGPDRLGFKIPVEITVYKDKTFNFILKTPPAAELIKKAAKKDKGSNAPGKVKVAVLKRDAIKSIAELKMPDLNAVDIDGAVKIIEGTARSMGIDIK